MWQWTSKETRLLRAAADGDAATVHALLTDSEPMDVNTRDWMGVGWTPLHYASCEGHLPVVKLLLEAQADVRATAKIGLLNASLCTPLDLALAHARLHVAEALLAAYDDNTPLHDACFHHQSDVAQILLTCGANVHAKDSDGRKPLHKCIQGKGSTRGVTKSLFVRSLTQETLLTLQALVSHGATWDEQCDRMVLYRKAVPEAAALRVCMRLWTLEHLDNRVLTTVPLEIIQRGADSTQTYLDSVDTSSAIVLRQKICLVGCSCAGKTSFVKSVVFNHPKLVHNDDRTIGIDHFPFRVVTTKTHEVTFWDFAGQDAYQVAHSLFFSPRTLFFVFIDLEAFTVGYLQASIMSNTKKQEEQLMREFIERTVMHWIRLILSRQPDAEFVFIATKEDLLAENTVVEKLLKDALEIKLTEVKKTVREMMYGPTGRKQLTQPLTHAQMLQAMSEDDQVTKPSVLFVSCTSPSSVQAARDRVEELIVNSERGFQMPDKYSQALEAIVDTREAAKMDDISARIHRVFARVDSLPQALKLEPRLCKIILQTLHDLGDVLWYEDLGVELFQDTVILDPLLLIDFIRQVINHTHTGQIIAHADLKALPFWMGLTNQDQLKAMKQVLQAFHLVYSADDDRVMSWDSDMIVPAYWQTKTPASWLFLGDILRLGETKTCEGEAVRVDWEYHFEFGLPSTLFDHLVVASVSPYFEFDAGPDWILYKAKDIAACRVMIGRDVKSLHRTIHIEAVVSETADSKQSKRLWGVFRQLCGAFVRVLTEYPGLAVSSFAWDDNQRKISLKRLVSSPPPVDASAWMPPIETWEWFKQLPTTYLRLSLAAPIAETKGRAHGKHWLEANLTEI